MPQIFCPWESRETIFFGAGLEACPTRPIGVLRRDVFGGDTWAIPPDFFWPLEAEGDFISGKNAIPYRIMAGVTFWGRNSAAVDLGSQP